MFRSLNVGPRTLNLKSMLKRWAKDLLIDHYVCGEVKESMSNLNIKYFTTNSYQMIEILVCE